MGRPVLEGLPVRCRESCRASYYDALTRVRQSNDLIHWVRFFLNGVAETAAKARDTFRKILALRDEVEPQVLSLGKRAPNARRALNALYRNPFITAVDLQSLVGITSPTANALIRDFE